jgi:hypothetical protein
VPSIQEELVVPFHVLLAARTCVATAAVAATATIAAAHAR